MCCPPAGGTASLVGIDFDWVNDLKSSKRLESIPRRPFRNTNVAGEGPLIENRDLRQQLQNHMYGGIRPQPGYSGLPISKNTPHIVDHDIALVRGPNQGVCEPGDPLIERTLTKGIETGEIPTWISRHKNTDRWWQPVYDASATKDPPDEDPTQPTVLLA